MQEAAGSLSPEQKSVLGTVFHFLESATVYLRSVLPVVSGPDERMLQGMIKLGESCMKRLPQYFPELQPLSEEQKKARWPVMNVAIYARVSTDKQDTENQALQLREFAEKQGWQITREYVDYETGSKADRAQFRQMFEDASRRKFDLVLFWALDRLSREGVLETLQHLNRLTSYGIAWRSYTEQFFDSCGPFRDAVIAIMATLAKQERIRRSERTKAGLARVRAAGRRLGRPVRLNGEHHAAVARLRAQGVSFRAIASQLGISLRSAQRLAMGGEE